MDIRRGLRKVALDIAYKFLDGEPAAGIPRLIDWVDRMDKNDAIRERRIAARRALSDRESPAYKRLCSLWSQSDVGIRHRTFENLVFNACIVTSAARADAGKRLGCVIPWALVIEPGGESGLDFDALDGIICQGEDLGIGVYLFAGNEALTRGDDIIALCNKHPDCEFFAVTGGGLVDEDMVRDMLRVKNLLPVIKSDVMNADALTASRAAMSLLREKGMIFGAYQAGAAWGAAFTLVLGDARFENNEMYNVFDFGTYPVIYSTGDIAPDARSECFATNIRQKTLAEALQSPLMMRYHIEGINAEVARNTTDKGA